MICIPTIGRRHFLAGTTALAGLSMSGASAVAQTPKRGGTLKMSVDQAVNKLNPLLTRVNPEYLIAELLYSNLTRLGIDMSPQPDLAESWSSSADLMEWTFKLRKGITFHDGSACTANDVVATFEAILDAKTASPARQNVGPLEKVTAADDSTVVFRLTTAYADLPVTLAYTNAKIVPASVIKAGLARVGSRSHRHRPVQAGLVRAGAADRRRAQPGLLRSRPPLSRPHPGRRLSGPDRGSLGAHLRRHGYDAQHHPDRVRPAVEGARRQAAAHALGPVLQHQFRLRHGALHRYARAPGAGRDGRSRRDGGFRGRRLRHPGNDTPLNSAYLFYADVPKKKPDIAKAKKLLADAGHAKGLDLTLIASDRPSVRTQLAVAIREMAKPAGFNINVQTMPHSTYLDQVWKKGSFYIGFYNMQATADAIFALLYTSNAAWNETRWNNAAFDKFVNEARTTIDEPKRRALYAEAQKMMHTEVPSIIPVFFDLLAGQRNYVQGYQLHPRGAVFRMDYVSLGDGAPRRG